MLKLCNSEYLAGQSLANGDKEKCATKKSETGILDKNAARAREKS